MPQIGWFEILVIVVLSILIIGPKDFPVMLKKVGSWIGTIKRYFNDIQNDINLSENIDEEISLNEDSLKKESQKKDE